MNWTCVYVWLIWKYDTMRQEDIGIEFYEWVTRLRIIKLSDHCWQIGSLKQRSHLERWFGIDMACSGARNTDPDCFPRRSGSFHSSALCNNLSGNRFCFRGRLKMCLFPFFLWLWVRFEWNYETQKHVNYEYKMK